MSPGRPWCWSVVCCFIRFAKKWANIDVGSAARAVCISHYIEHSRRVMRPVGYVLRSPAPNVLGALTRVPGTRLRRFLLVFPRNDLPKKPPHFRELLVFGQRRIQRLLRQIGPHSKATLLVSAVSLPSPRPPRDVSRPRSAGRARIGVPKPIVAASHPPDPVPRAHSAAPGRRSSLGCLPKVRSPPGVSALAVRRSR